MATRSELSESTIDTLEALERAAPDVLVTILAGETLEDVARMALDADTRRGELSRAAKAHAGLRDRLNRYLEQTLGAGEAVIATDTDHAAFVGLVSDGTAEPNRAALDELVGRLPEHLKPTTTTKYPSVGAIEKTRAWLEENGLSVRKLVNYPAKRQGLRWRKLEGMGEDEVCRPARPS